MSLLTQPRLKLLECDCNVKRSQWNSGKYHGNPMTSDNLAALKEVVLRNGVLRELHWDQNNITSKHVLGLTHALKQNKALQMVQFPDKDFEKELMREKRTAKKMELQMIKRNFYRAVFENAATQGFQQSTTNYKRTA